MPHLGHCEGWARSKGSEGKSVIQHSDPLVLELILGYWADLCVITQLCANAKVGVTSIEIYSLCLNGGQDMTLPEKRV